MEPQDVAGQLSELAEEQEELRAERQVERLAERDKHARDERFRRRAALSIAFLAMLLAINSVGGENAGKEMVNRNIQASDTWAFFQAKNIRQTSFRLAAEQLELLAPTLPPEQQPEARRRIDAYKATGARYESEPDPDDPTNPLKGDGKKELTARARDHEAKREHAQRQDPNFDYAGALFQIAIVLGSVAVLSLSRIVLGLGLGLGAIATVLMLNGFLLWFDLPIG